MQAYIHGDCLDEIAQMRSDYFDSICTDPPYSLSFMNRDWDSFNGHREFQRWCESWAAECLRVLKPGGFLLAFGGTRTYHRLACGIEDAGFEIHDSLMWIHGQGFPKAKTCLKPAHEPIVMARKPAKKMQPLNIDECRIGSEARVNPPAGNKPGGASLNMSVVGMPQDAAPRAAVGRWPANVILSHSEDCKPSGTRRVPTGTHVGRNRNAAEVSNEIYGPRGKDNRDIGYADAGGLETMEAWNCVDGCPVAELDRQSGRTTSRQQPRTARRGGSSTNFAMSTSGRTHADSGGASRFFYCAKASKAERPHIDGIPDHPTVKPLALIRHLVRLVTPAGGLLLDPFAGTGTTAEACELENIDSVSIEREEDSVRLMAKRLEKYERQAA